MKLTTHDQDMLTTLTRSNWVSALYLAGVFHTTRPEISRQLRRFKRRGWVEAIPAALWRITPAGRSALQPPEENT